MVEAGMTVIELRVMDLMIESEGMHELAVNLRRVSFRL